jgi:outer membrane lipoprotein-sorting protein
MKSLIVILLSIMTLNLTGQSDPEGINVLDKFSSTALASPSVSMKFNLITINQMEKTNDTAAGSIIMAKDQYRLELANNITWHNGSAIWNYLIAEKEVTITKPDKKDDSFLSKPSAIFTLYKKGYKTRYIEENSSSYTIDLYPVDIKSDLIRIRLKIGKRGSDLLSAEYKRKDGITIYLIVNEYNLNVKPDPSFFTFNPQNYKGVEIIDIDRKSVV